MNVEQLDASEKQAFLTWRRKLARLVLFYLILLRSVGYKQDKYLSLEEFLLLVE